MVHNVPAAPPSVNLVPFEDVCRPFPPSSEDLSLYGRMDDFQERFDRIQREMKALRGKDLFGQNVNEMCLVPNVKIPAKFKVPEFEKYKGVVPQNFPSHFLQDLLRACFKISQRLHSPMAS